MSGPVSTDDSPAHEGDEHPTAPPTLERTAARTVDLAGITVRRALPRRGRRTVGAWCFVDHFGADAPSGADEAGSAAGGPTMAVGPHPHIGLQTVTWLLEGEVLHTDSLGSEQLIRPGQLNLMTAGRGVAHAEHTPPSSAVAQRGAQLWIAQPEATRHGDPAFAHHADLDAADLGGGITATVLVGELGGVRSPARTDTPLVGAAVSGGAEGRGAVALHPRFEYAVVVLAGAASLAGPGLDDDEPVVPGQLAYLGAGRDELALRTITGTELLLLGGEPFETEPLMWWNFVARTHDEIRAARADWQAGHERFAPVASSLAPIDAPEVPF
ncbi:pirin family protein [Rhabdothermincola salaria]|uniref:pirin family protein n=1 Tax=Rhabdothermincola salaria TaxID=2903142 RepID=UPI001E4F6E67|nr:pirin family protein [Rhabdothermincola salaria]MCD9622239.1 pirin family protein [Rhabdothermincola salaria]